MSRIICLDYGYARIGVAVSDPTRTIATAKDFINVKQGGILGKIISLIEEYECEELVIGLPISLNGKETKMSQDVRAFADKLKEYVNIPIILWDERLTSYAAEEILIEGNIKPRQRKEKIDSLSAKIVLQDYLDHLSKES